MRAWGVSHVYVEIAWCVPDVPDVQVTHTRRRTRQVVSQQN